MKKIEKLFRKLSKKDIAKLRQALLLITQGKIKSLDVKKVRSKTYYRARVGKFRIKFIYHKAQKKFEVTDIDRRSEKTYHR